MLEKMLFAASCMAAFEGASGMEGVITVPLDLKMSHSEKVKAVIAQVVSVEKDGSTSNSAKDKRTNVLLKRFFDVGCSCLDKSTESPDFYTASFFIEILSDPKCIYHAACKKQKKEQLSIDEWSDFFEKSREYMINLKRKFDEKKSLQESEEE